MRVVIYQDHFGLHEMPFGITPDTSFVYDCSGHQEALNTLLIAIKNGEGFMKITGEVGTGKTLLCRRFLATMDSSCVSAYILNPALEPRTLLLALADELGVTLPKDADEHQLLKQLALVLLRLARQRKSIVLCLDEAQAMPIESLEALRLLTNLETEKRKLLQVVLFGQPELDRKLAQAAVRQLRQRITFQYQLTALSGDELEYYLAHRLRIAGYRGNRLFTRSAVRTLHRVSGGIPRLVNVIAHKAMLLAYGEGEFNINRQHIRAAAHDTPAARGKNWWWFAFAILLASVGSVGWMILK